MDDTLEPIETLEPLDDPIETFEPFDDRTLVGPLLQTLVRPFIGDPS